MSWLQHFIRIHSVIKYAGMFPTVANKQEALFLVMRYHIKAEIIGQWLYCFTTPLIGFQLETVGFWNKQPQIVVQTLFPWFKVLAFSGT